MIPRTRSGTLGLRSGDSVWADREADAVYEQGERASEGFPPCAGPVNPESEEARRGREEDAKAHGRALRSAYGNDLAGLIRHAQTCPTCKGVFAERIVSEGGG